jgi:outer membrane receptor for ferric coprogen and ferric-rhodotorulic acid
MEDRNLNLLTDVMDQATGVTRVNRNFGDNQFSMRGFLVQDANYMVDGVSGLVFSPNGWVPMDMAMYDRAEILRGSAGMLIGAGDPSGAINMVRKRPRAEKHFDFAASVGSWNNYRSEVDFGGAINDAGTLRGRAVVTYEDRKYFTDITHSKQPLFYGVIEADLTRDTTLFAGARYQKRTVDGYSVFGLPRYTNGQTIPVHRSTSLTQPWAQNDAFTKEVFADLEHRLNDQWKAKLSYNHTEAGFDQKVPIVRGAVNPLTGVGANYYTVSYRDQEVTSDGVDANLTGAFSAFGKQHEVLFGASWSKRTSDINTVNSGISPLIPVDMFNPGASIVNEPNRPAWGVQNRVTDIRYGVYGNTRLQLAEPLHLLIGTRLSWYDNETRSRVTGVKTTGATQSAQLTPYMALTYDLNKQWTAYVSYTDSFMPQSDYQTFDGKLLDPEVGSSYEAGIKGELLNGRLNTSFAVFQINKQNSAIPDPNHTTQCGNYVCSLNDNGKSTSSGFELEASGEVTSKWQIAGGYTYSKRVTEEGKIFSAETPRHMLRLSTNYKLTKQWTVGGGVSAQSGYTHQTTGRPEYDGGRAVWDLRSNYQITDHWSVAVAVANLFDKTYWISNGELARGNYYGDPRNMTVTLRGRF